MFFATFVKCRSHEAIRLSKNVCSAGVNRCASFTESAVAALPMRGASAAEGRAKECTAGVFFATLEVIAIGFALFFTGGTGCDARNRGERGIACCSSTCSTNVIDFTVGVACFARSLRGAHNSRIGTHARHRETLCPVDLCSFDF